MGMLRRTGLALAMSTGFLFFEEYQQIPESKFSDLECLPVQFASAIRAGYFLVDNAGFRR
jgi:hypothetical protein